MRRWSGSVMWIYLGDIFGVGSEVFSAVELISIYLLIRGHDKFECILYFFSLILAMELFNPQSCCNPMFACLLTLIFCVILASFNHRRIAHSTRQKRINLKIPNEMKTWEDRRWWWCCVSLISSHLILVLLCLLLNPSNNKELRVVEGGVHPEISI